MTGSPHSLALLYFDQFRQCVPAARDADVESVHQARVASRRLREVLPLLVGDARAINHAEAVAREAGRALGVVRELDVIQDLLCREERLVPSAAPAIAVARLNVSQRQERARRRMVKALDRLELDTIGDVLTAHPSARSWQVRERYARGHHSAHLLRERVHAHAVRLDRSIEHASGVYFPNRVHRVRIAVKKLRYSVELAVATGVWRPMHVVGDLKRAQATLGDLHDIQVLVDHLDQLLPDDALRSQAASFRSALQAQSSPLHASYLSTRDRLRALTAACREFGDQRPRMSLLRIGKRPMVAASALFVPAALMIGQRRT